MTVRGAATAVGLIALLPTALNGIAAAASGPVLVRLCGGGTMALPTGGPPRDERDHCAQACHVGCSRKRIQRAI